MSASAQAEPTLAPTEAPNLSATTSLNPSAEPQPPSHQQNAQAASAEVQTLQLEIEKHEIRISTQEKDHQSLKGYVRHMNHRVQDLMSYVENLNQTVQDLMDVVRENDEKLVKMAQEKDAEIEELKARLAVVETGKGGKKFVVKFELEP